MAHGTRRIIPGLAPVSVIVQTYLGIPALCVPPGGQTADAPWTADALGGLEAQDRNNEYGIYSFACDTDITGETLYYTTESGWLCPGGTFTMYLAVRDTDASPVAVWISIGVCGALADVGSWGFPVDSGFPSIWPYQNPPP